MKTEEDLEELVQILGLLLNEARRVARELLVRADYADVTKAYQEKYPWLKETK